MKIINISYFPFIIWTILVTKGYGEVQRTKDKMYEPINAISTCFRRMNGTHQTGCSSTREGSTGVVHFLSKPTDIDTIIRSNNGLSYIPVMPVTYFTKAMFADLNSSSLISGIVLYKTNDSIKSFSHDDSCPNRYSNIDGTCEKKWNTEGTGLLLEDLPFPIFYMSEEEDVDKVRDCFIKFNNFSYETHPDRSLCSLELKGFMFASKDTPTCIRRSNSVMNLNPIKFCDPMGDRNVWASLFPIGTSNQTKGAPVRKDMKYIIVAARMDTTSLLHDIVPGASNPITGLVALLSTAQLLKRMITEYKDNYEKNVLFILFNGETYDYIGSQRVVYDMQQSKFPVPAYYGEGESIPNIHTENISLYIEISQMTRSGKVHLYSHKETDPMRNFINILKKSNHNNLNIIETVGYVPPASFHTFIKDNSNISGLVFADHGDQYVNKYYNSIFDDSDNVQFTYINTTDENDIPKESIQEHIAQVSDLLALSLYEEITGNPYQNTKDVKADRLIVNELFHCYLENANCTVHQAVKVIQFKQMPLSLYVGVTMSPNYLPRLIGLTLAWFTGEVVPTNIDGCYSNMTSYVYRYFNMSESIMNLNSTKCYRTSFNITEAESPAFQIEDYDWKSGQYSTWSESTWREFSMRIFLKPSRMHEIMTIVIGTITFILSAVIVYVLNAKAVILFESNNVSPTNC